MATPSRASKKSSSKVIAKDVVERTGATVSKRDLDALPHPNTGITIAKTNQALPATRQDKQESNLKWIKDKGWQSPLEFLVEVMNNSGVDRGTRIDAAKAAAPYVHAKLQSVMVESPHDQVDSEIKALFRDALAADKAAGPPAPSAEYEPS
jgi:hypothetical protein